MPACKVAGLIDTGLIIDFYIGLLHVCLVVQAGAFVFEHKS